MADYIGAIDFFVFDRDGTIVAVDQREHEQIHPRAGWVEHDPKAIETTAYAAGFWSGQDEPCERWADDKRWLPEQDREAEYARWKKAMQRSLDWVA